jgi:hypothetical protein
MIDNGKTEPTGTPSQPLESAIVVFFRQLAESLPPGSAQLGIGPNPEATFGGTRVELKPALAEAATIIALALNRGVVYLTFGRATLFEAQMERGGSPRSLIEHIEPLCKAVIDGMFEENISVAGSEVFKSVGKLNVGGKVITIHYRGSFHPFGRTQKRHIKYAPFSG